MPRFVTDTCISCGSCVEQCPVSCITMEEQAKIDADSCIDCGSCEAVCPVSAIIAQ